MVEYNKGVHFDFNTKKKKNVIQTVKCRMDYQNQKLKIDERKGGSN